MADLIIRTADEPDIEALSDLYVSFHDFHAEHLPGYLLPLGSISATERESLSLKIREIIHGPDSAILVAEYSGRVTGMAEITLRHANQEERGVTKELYAHLQSLFIADGCKRQGFGTQLLQVAETWANEHGCTELRLDIWEFSDGPLEFYEKRGYHTLRRTLVKTLNSFPSGEV